MPYLLRLGDTSLSTRGKQPPVNYAPRDRVNPLTYSLSVRRNREQEPEVGGVRAAHLAFSPLTARPSLPGDVTRLEELRVGPVAFSRFRTPTTTEGRIGTWQQWARGQGISERHAKEFRDATRIYGPLQQGQQRAKSYERYRPTPEGSGSRFSLHEGRGRTGFPSFGALESIHTKGSTDLHVIPMRLGDFEKLSFPLPPAERFDPRNPGAGGTRVGGATAGSWDMDARKPWGRRTGMPALHIGMSADGRPMIVGHDARHRVQEMLKLGMSKDTTIPVQMSLSGGIQTPILTGAGPIYPRAASTREEIMAVIRKGLIPELDTGTAARERAAAVERAARSGERMLQMYDLDPTDRAFAAMGTTGLYSGGADVRTRVPSEVQELIDRGTLQQAHYKTSGGQQSDRLRPVHITDTPLQRLWRSIKTPTPLTAAAKAREFAMGRRPSVPIRYPNVFHILRGLAIAENPELNIPINQRLAAGRVSQKVGALFALDEGELLHLPKDDDDAKALIKLSKKNEPEVYTRKQQVKDVLKATPGAVKESIGKIKASGASGVLRGLGRGVYNLSKAVIGPEDIAIELLLHMRRQSPHVKRQETIAKDIADRQRRDTMHNQRTSIMRYGSTKDRALLIEYMNRPSTIHGTLTTKKEMKAQAKRDKEHFGGMDFPAWLQAAAHRTHEATLSTKAKRNRKKRQDRLTRDVNIRGAARF